MTSKEEALSQDVPGTLLPDKDLILRYFRPVKTLAVVLAVIGVLVLLSQKVDWIDSYPEQWVVPVRDWLNVFMKWLIHELSFGLFTFKELTRSLAWLVGWPFTLGMGLLVKGFDLSLWLPLFGKLEFHLPHISWIGVTACVFLLGHYLQGWRLALVSGCCFLYLAIFGQWFSAMETFSSILIAVPLGVLIGLVLGILSYWSGTAEMILRPILDMMQTVPIFAYLVPILFLFGFGPVSAMLGTVIYAVPPMVRCTHLGLQAVPKAQIESGIISGCTPSQLFWKIKIPSALRQIMVGINQVIMLTLNMVIIASMIGAGGLGYDVLSALRRLQIGRGLEAGIAIVVLAIALDRLSQASAKGEVFKKSSSKNFLQNHSHVLLGVICISLTMIFGFFFQFVQTYPENLQITTAPFWDWLMSWINVNLYDALYGIRTFLLIYLLVPAKKILLAIPWSAVVGGLGFIAYRLGGWRLSLLVILPALFPAITGYWEKTMYTVYLCGIGVLIATLLGVLIGVLAAGNNRLSQVLNVILDTLQTLPAFVYLMPCVMLFRVGDVSALVAIVAYAIVPAVRYTLYGIRQVPFSVLEASTMSGCRKVQLLFKVQLPLALPQIMLGVNQTIMLALSMVVITSLIGTSDLGQEVYIALTKADIGRGLVAGLGVACIATVSDRLIQAYVEAKKKKIGLA